MSDLRITGGGDVSSTAMTIEQAGTTHLGDLEVPRIGYGTMRLPGPRVWGPPADRDVAIAVLRRSVELGVRVLDTAWYYGLDVANELVAAALHPYPGDLVLVTKLGGARDESGAWVSGSRPEELRRGNERDLRVLRLESVPVTHLRWAGEHAPVPFEESLGAMLELVTEGRIQRLGISNVSIEQLRTAQAATSVVCVSNSYGITHREDDPMVDVCAQEGIAYLPFFPLGVGAVDDNEVVSAVAQELSASPAQIALAWLLQRSATMLPIPGTANVAHLEENVAAAKLELSADQMGRLSSAPESAVVMARR